MKGGGSAGSDRARGRTEERQTAGAGSRGAPGAPFIGARGGERWPAGLLWAEHISGYSGVHNSSDGTSWRGERGGDMQVHAHSTTGTKWCLTPLV